MNGEKHLIEIPLVAGLRRASTQGIDIALTTLQAPLANRFISQLDTSRGHDLLDVAVAQREAIGQPNANTKNLRRKAMTFGEGSRKSRFLTPHSATLFNHLYRLPLS
jgi:hypothetical protein